MTNDLCELVEAMEPHSPPHKPEALAVDTWEADGGAPPPIDEALKTQDYLPMKGGDA